MKRFIVAFLALDSFGQGCYISRFSGSQFFSVLTDAASNAGTPCPLGGRWQKGGSRGQRSGNQVVRSIKAIEHHGSPEAFIDAVTAKLDYASYSEAVAQHWGWGEWCRFKMGDMLERVMRIPLRFTDDSKMCGEPEKGAVLWADTHPTGFPETKQHKIQRAISYLRETLAAHRAPPHHDRPLNIQEFETVFCKWNKHTKGKYPVGDDIPKLRASLAQWAPFDDMAEGLLRVYPQPL